MCLVIQFANLIGQFILCRLEDVHKGGYKEEVSFLSSLKIPLSTLLGYHNVF